MSPSKAIKADEPQTKSEITEKQAAPLTSAPAKPKSQQDHQESTKNDLASSQSTTFKYSDVSSTKSELLEPSSLSSHDDLERGAASVLTPGLGGVKQSRVVEQEASNMVDTLFLKVLSYFKNIILMFWGFLVFMVIV